MLWGYTSLLLAEFLRYPIHNKNVYCHIKTSQAFFLVKIMCRYLSEYHPLMSGWIHDLTNFWYGNDNKSLDWFKCDAAQFIRVAGMNIA